VSSSDYGGAVIQSATDVTSAATVAVPDTDSAAYTTMESASAGSYVKGATFDAVAHVATAVNIATLADPQCIRLVVNFNGIPGDLAALKVDVSDVKYAGYTNAQEANAKVSGTVAESITVATGGHYSYTAPTAMTLSSTAFDGAVANEATCSSADSTAACTQITMGTTAANLGATPKTTFYPKTKIEVTCTVSGGAARSLGIHTVLSVDETGNKIWLEGLIPASTISASGCTNAKIKIDGRSHFAVTGVDPDTAAIGSETGVDMGNVMADLLTSSAHELHLSAVLTASAGTVDHASTFDVAHVVAADTTNAPAATSTIFLFATESLVTAGHNAAASSVGTIASSRVAAFAATIIDGDEDFTDDEASTSWVVNGKGTQETAECGARGLCDTEAGQCKCFPGYIGLSCSTQASIAM